MLVEALFCVDIPCVFEGGIILETKTKRHANSRLPEKRSQKNWLTKADKLFNREAFQLSRRR